MTGHGLPVPAGDCLPHHRRPVVGSPLLRTCTVIRRRSAIYSRKSTEEGLEQAFNSLDAQREACGPHVHSQRHEGWHLVKTAHDDDGFSGGSMERPALKRLMQDVSAGLADVIVVYKIDRLTRTLADFAKMVEVFDAGGVSFVSVTQQFSITASMGRLTSTCCCPLPSSNAK